MPDVIGVVCGLQSEARRLPARPQLRVAISGASARRAEEAADRLLAEGADVLLSFGVAGGLAPEAQVGELVLADEVMTETGERWPADAGWLGRLRESLPEASVRVLFGSDVIVGDVAEKARLAAKGAYAVDMESHAVARAAARAHRPFAVLRAIADPATRVIPASAAYGVGEKGETRAWPVLKAAAKRPGDLIKLMQVGADSAKALAALRAVAPAILSGR